MNAREILKEAIKDRVNSALDETIYQVLKELRELVPEEYPIVESLLEERIIWMKGWNSCRQEMLKRLK